MQTRAPASSRVISRHLAAQTLLDFWALVPESCKLYRRPRELQVELVSVLAWCVKEREGRVGVGQLVFEEGAHLACAVLEPGVHVAEDRRHADEDEEDDEEDPTPGNLFLIRGLV